MLSRMNPELGEPEAGDITDAGLNETDEWRWTVGHLNVSNRPPGLGSNGERTQERGDGSNRSWVHTAFCRTAREKSN